MLPVISSLSQSIELRSNSPTSLSSRGIFESDLKHNFKYPADHISRTTLYTFEQTLELAARIEARKVLFVHLEEYLNRSYDDYCALESDGIKFAYDGMQINV
jgi:phosphoribosyl 1,2-cyclic phosphate phosphodiesterase